jgi:hypothetical protein
MKFWNALSTVSRYVLAAISCISLAQFLLLLNVGTENAGRLAGQSLGRGVITGLVAAVWFYRARKVSPQVPANVQTQLPLVEKSQVQSTPSPRDSGSTTATVPVPTADHSVGSFLEKHVIGLIAVAAIVVTIVTLTTVTPWIFAPSTGTSQPRFVHVQGAPPWKMFDNKTGQECNTEAVSYDSVDRIKRDMHSPVFNDQLDELKNKCDIERTWNCISSVNLDTTTDSLITELLTSSKPEPKSNDHFWDSLVIDRSTYPQYKQFYDRYDAVIANPDRPPVYHYNGMPYCSELSKKWW